MSCFMRADEALVRHDKRLLNTPLGRGGGSPPTPPKKKNFLTEREF